MWERSELKERAKAVLHTCYWNAVLVSLVLMIVTGASSGGGGGTSGNNSSSGSYSGTFDELQSLFEDPSIVAVMAIVMGVFAVAMLIGIAVKIFLCNPVEVGARRFFMISRENTARVGELGFAFKNSYMNVVKTQFLRDLFTSLWSLLLVVPGIIKSYEYRMMPYILAENPDIDYKDAFRLSKEMMDGEKWNTFVLDVSFIGWVLLSAITCGILALFYVTPYTNLTNAELYAVLREKVLVNGASSTYELKGFAE